MERTLVELCVSCALGICGEALCLVIRTIVAFYRPEQLNTKAWCDDALRPQYFIARSFATTKLWLLEALKGTCLMSGTVGLRPNRVSCSGIKVQKKKKCFREH